MLQSYPWVFATSLVFAVGIPLTLIYLRRAVRNDRSAVIAELEDIFSLTKSNPSFEFLKYKYDVSYNKVSSLQMIASAAPFSIALLFGVCFIFSPISHFSDTALSQGGSPLYQFMLMGTDAPAKASADTKPAPACGPPVGAPLGCAETTPAESHARFRNGLTVLALVFAGSMLFAMRYLLGAIMTFELGPLSFLKMTLHIMTAQVVAVVLWRLSANVAVFGEKTTEAVALAMLAPVAFFIGYVPDLGLRYLATRVALPFKASRDDLLPKVQSTPLEVIDGIDAATCFRLNDAMLRDVQHLATTNPLALYVETPYGLYQSVDWVAQAQLCTVVGPDAFVALRAQHIRTIIDFKGATGSEATSRMRLELGALLFPARPDDGLPPLEDADLQKLFAVMLDDLHVRRLQQLWDAIDLKLKPMPKAEPA